MAAPLFVGLDVGGTAMKAGVVDDSGQPLACVSLPTEAHRGPGIRPGTDVRNDPPGRGRRRAQDERHRRHRRGARRAPWTSRPA